MQKIRQATKVAMREKEFGIWIPFTWQDYYDNVKYIALGHGQPRLRSPGTRWP